ncbi:hypothetical protein Sjap_007824 [Stephania japonica]|uniref:F-box associated beta-propeller type 3 domain-containing protein n=1 Tax=Stephania japonica TaxID=461633 RepID=A0AAP0PE15_9MAGN
MRNRWCVSKSWLELISDPHFIKAHLKQSHLISKDIKIMLKSDDYIYSVDIVDGNLVVVDPHCPRPLRDVRDTDDEILGSCNGLLYMFGTFLWLWNPATGDRIKVPDSPDGPDHFSREYCSISYGFGYDQIIDDYKVVEVHCYDYVDLGALSEARVYSYALNSWNIITELPYVCIDRTGKLANGALHWVAHRCDDESQSNLIISFDIRSEEFQEVSLPDEFKDEEVYLGVAVLAGSLSILRYGTFRLEILLDKSGEGLILYDPKDGRNRNIRIPGLSKWDETHIYVESLVTLDFEESEGHRSIEEDHVNRLHEELLQPQLGSTEPIPVDATKFYYTTTGGQQKSRVYDIDMEGLAMNGATAEGSSSNAPIYTEEQFQRQVERIVDERLSHFQEQLRVEMQTEMQAYMLKIEQRLLVQVAGTSSARHQRQNPNESRGDDVVTDFPVDP